MGKTRRHTVHTGAMMKKNNTRKTMQPIAKTTRYAKNSDVDDYDDQGEDEMEEQQLFLKFDNDKQDNDDIHVDGLTNVEGVMDLGLDMSDSEEDGDEEDEDEELYDDESDKGNDLQEEEDTSSRNDDDYEYYTSLKDKIESVKNNILDWGTKKKNYYHGDTADLEIGQDIEDAELEEEAGREVLKARLQRMEETDFYDDETDRVKTKTIQEEEKSKTMNDSEEQSNVSLLSSKRIKNHHSISAKEKKRILQKQHPELFPLLEHFRDTVIRPCVDETLVVQKALLSQDADTRKAIGTTSTGIQYLLTKSMVQMSAALNICQYLLIKADIAAKAEDSTADVHSNPFQINFLTEEDGIQSHPVVERLNHLNVLLETLEESVEKKVPDLKEQLASLRKASYLIQHGDVNDNDDNEISEEERQDKTNDTSDDESDIELCHSNLSDEDVDVCEEDNRGQLKPMEKFTVGSRRNEAELKRQILNEARFSLRSHDDEIQNGNKRRNRDSLLEDSDYLFDDPEHENVSNQLKAGKSLTSTLNTITQKMGGKKQKVVDPEAEVEDFEKALTMMEQDLESKDEHEGELDYMGDDYDDDELKDSVEDGFYSKVQKKSKDKKNFKRVMYAVAPKFPRIDEEIEGERPIGNAIMKNRGLKKHRPKLDRNPRVKKREQYRKAVIRRKGAVRDIRTGEGHKYGGEETGIKSNLSRSRKLGL